VVWRGEGGDAEFLVAHRPRYDDWSLPKGKLEDGESFREAAERELEEETGCRGTFGPELTPATYVDHKGRDKIVRYWLVEVDPGAASFEPNDEVDEIAWLPADEAVGRLSYPHDVRLVAEATAALASP